MTNTQGQKNQISVRVLFFGAARDVVGKSEVELKLTSPANAAAAFDHVLETFPNLRRFGRSLLLAVNQEYVSRTDREVHDGDELALFPPVSGGGNRITRKRS